MLMVSPPSLTSWRRLVLASSTISPPPPALEAVLDRGRQDGTIRPDISGFDVIVFGALLAQPLPHVPNWKLTAPDRPSAT